MPVIKQGYENGCVECSYLKIIMTRIHHFHPRVITWDSSGQHRLKIGVDTTTRLREFAIENDQYKEETNYAGF